MPEALRGCTGFAPCWRSRSATCVGGSTSTLGSALRSNRRRNWHFTSQSARRLFDEIFPPGGVEVRVYGNVLAAVAFLHGLAAEELRPDELDYSDLDYEVIIGIKAERPADGPEAR